tara:strand:+ start:1021 stop:2664 length:1644 start_codon:yes stop_codon:yes gene_type:complete
MRKVIYTTIFGGYDNLVEPQYKPEGWDFICFTDSDLKSDTWKIVKKPLVYTDNTRTAKRFKVLPHKYLSDYDYSIFIDGNMTIRGDVNDLINKHLSDSNVAFFDHAQNRLDPNNCIYREADYIFYLGQKNNGNYKDNPILIQKQMERYKQEGYPQKNGLITGMVILRKHNETDCIKVMEKWWEEIKYNSKRDQLSFNYSAWKTDVKFNYMDGDSRDNEYFISLGKHTGKGKNVEQVIEPINLDYFLSMELQKGGGGKERITNDHKLNTVEDVVNFYSDPNNLEEQKSKLHPTNWQYFNCMTAGFKKDVGDHHELGWDKMTEEYYSNLEDMSDEEIEKFLKDNPAEFDNGFIRHSYHRACAMIGRLINGKKYIPFYMKKEQIYNEPRKKDGIQRRFSLTRNINCLKLLDRLGIPKGEFTICQSGILALMGIRQNDDLDIIISSEARKQLFNGSQEFMRFDGVEIFEANKSKFKYFNAQGDDDLIDNYSFEVGGYNFLEPRFYFSRKNKKTEKDLKDWEGMKRFFDMENYKGYPFNKLTLEQWGEEYIK